MEDTTIPAWSASIGMSKQAGYAAVKRCNIPIVDGKLDAGVATALYKSRTRARVNTKRASSAAGSNQSAGAPGHCSEAAATDERISYEEARRLRETAEARMAELKLAEQRGDLIRADAVRAEWSRILAGLRESFLQMPSRVVPLLVVAADAHAMDELLRAEINVALRSVSEGAA